MCVCARAFCVCDQVEEQLVCKFCCGVEEQDLCVMSDGCESLAYDIWDRHMCIAFMIEEKNVHIVWRCLFDQRTHRVCGGRSKGP